MAITPRRKKFFVFATFSHPGMGLVGRIGLVGWCADDGGTCAHLALVFFDGEVLGDGGAAGV